MSLSLAGSLGYVSALAQADDPIDPCTKGTGGYPAYCRPIRKIIVCDNGPVHADPPDPPGEYDPNKHQQEPAITMVRSDCDRTLVGVWMDKAGEIRDHLAMSLSVDRGRTWFAPGEHTTECPDPFPDVRRFLNDCYFAGCDMVGGVPECDLLPEDCDYTIEPTEWGAADEGICAGGNGYIYMASADRPVGVHGLLFTRSKDHGATFGLFEYPGEPNRPLKHICPADQFNPDRVGIAASPDPVSNDVFVYWNDAGIHDKIMFMGSTDAGDTFSGDIDPDEATVVRSVSYPWKVHAPAGAVWQDPVSQAEFLIVVWANINQGELFQPTQIEKRRRSSAGNWIPPIDADPNVIAGPFRGWNYFGGGFSERSVPAIAVDRTTGPYDGWLYVVYADHGDPNLPPPESLARIRLVRSCNGGRTWSTAVTISPDLDHQDRVQFYPRVEVDGRGNIGVSWYDTRYDDGLGAQPKYDIFFAYSSDAGETWQEKRVSGSGTDPAFFNPNLYPLIVGPQDYSGMTADPTPGTSAFYVLPMGVPDGVGKQDQDIYSYEVILRVRGDYAGDFDVDVYDAAWNNCWGPLAGLPCDCETLDFDDDGDVDEEDFDTFYAFVTGPVCECHGPCQHDGGCGDAGESAGGGFGSDAADQMPPACEAVAWFVTYAPVEYVYGFEERLIEYLAEHGDDAEADGSWHILECLQSVLP